MSDYTKEESDLSIIPFIETNSYKNLSRSILSFFNAIQNNQNNYLGLIVGSIGVGKTTSILRLRQELDEKVENTKYLNRVYKKNSDFYREVTGSYQSYAPIFEKKWNNNKSIIIFDLPDKASKKDLSSLLDFIQNIFTKYKTSVILVLNQQQYSQASSLSTIFGKFKTYTLDPFSLNETMSMIYERLQKWREKGSKLDNPLFPFEETLIERIHQIARGNPRNIINICYKLLESNEKTIDKVLLMKIAETDYIMDLLKSRIGDIYYVTVLKQVFDIIVEKFDGIAPSQQDVVREARKLYGWNVKTIRKYLKRLEDVGVISIQRNEEEPWKKSYLVSTRVVTE